MDFATRALLAMNLLAVLGGCTFGAPLSSEDREAISDCRAESDRIFAVRNRYQLSERYDSQDTPDSANNLASAPNAGLRDQYERDQLYDDCMARSAAGSAALGDNAPITTPGK